MPIWSKLFFWARCNNAKCSFWVKCSLKQSVRQPSLLLQLETEQLDVVGFILIICTNMFYAITSTTYTNWINSSHSNQALKTPSHPYHLWMVPKIKDDVNSWLCLTSLPYVHTQVNLIIVYFDRKNINLYDVLSIINSLALRSGQILNQCNDAMGMNACGIQTFFLHFSQ